MKREPATFRLGGSLVTGTTSGVIEDGKLECFFGPARLWIPVGEVK